MTKSRRNSPVRRILLGAITVAGLMGCFPMHGQDAGRDLRLRYIALYEQKLEAARAAGNRKEEAKDLLELGRIHSAPGEEKEAIDCYNRALALQRRLGDERGEATALSGLAAVYAGLGQKQKALDYLNQAGSVDILSACVQKTGSQRR